MGTLAVVVITTFVGDWTHAPSNRMELGGKTRDMGSKLLYCVIMDSRGMAGHKLSRNAIRVLQARYLRRDALGRITETPGQLFERVARAVAHAETILGNADRAPSWESKFYEMLSSLDFLPNSPTLMNAGTPLGQLSACFVLPVEDTIEGIFEAVKQMALITRTGGGIGFSFSKLRPRGDVLATSGGQASGPVSFMQIFDAATEHIKQGGRRRGANMGVLRVDHPDILEFITAKLDEKRLQNFNVSVGVTDQFMEAVRENRYYSLVHPRTGKVTTELRAREVFDAIIEAAWHTGDPGLLFLDTINRANPTPNWARLRPPIPAVKFHCCLMNHAIWAPLIWATWFGNAAVALKWIGKGFAIRCTMPCGFWITS